MTVIELLKPNINMWDHLGLLIFLSYQWTQRFDVVNASICLITWMIVVGWFAGRLLWRAVEVIE